MRSIPRRLALLAPAVLILGAALVAAVLLAGAGRTPAPAEAQQAGLAWSGCGGQFECATFKVPLDYAQPDGRQIDLRLIRLPARDASKRIGALLSNPGGPGGSGIDFMRAWARTLDDDIRERFDLVSFDPRGVGQSTPLLCHNDIRDIIGLEPEPDTADEWAEARHVLRAFGELCATRGGDLLPHLGSLNVARDMDRIREAVGDRQLTYVGYSYGTVIGALYADLFPDRVRAMVLDGPVDLSLSPDDQNATQALGFERALSHFAADCRARDCALTRGGRDPIAAIEELIERARTASIPSSNADRPAGPGEALLAVVAALYREGFWPSLETAIQQGLEGEGSWLVQLADRLWGRQGDEFDNSLEMNTAVNCLDYEYIRDPAHYEARSRVVAQLAPTFGASFGTTGLACALWPVTPKPIGTPDGAGAPPLLVIGTTGDPATPFEWALAMRRDLVTSVLLTFEGEGHTAYAAGNSCVDGVVDAYLLTLALPEDGAVCRRGADAPQSAATPPSAAFPPRGAPALSAAATAEPTPATTRDEPSGNANWVWLVLGMIAVGLAVAAVWTTLRARWRV